MMRFSPWPGKKNFMVHGVEFQNRKRKRVNRIYFKDVRASNIFQKMYSVKKIFRRKFFKNKNIWRDSSCQQPSST